MKKYKILSVFICILLVSIGISFIYIGMQLQPVGSNQKIIYEVKENSTIESVLKDLEEQNVIKNSFIAYQYAKYIKPTNLKAGKFELNTNDNIAEILTQLSQISPLIDKTIVLYLPEGKWAKDYALAIANVTGYEIKEILNLWNNPEYISKLQKKYWFLKDVTQNNNARVLLEGYFSGNTYFLDKDMSVEDITEMILDQREKELNPYQSQLQNLNIHELFTKASLVQYEAKTLEDQRMVAQVIENRLSSDQKLELSVTICYALYDELTDWKDCEINAQLVSPFNTYLNKGLPPTPILNPTITAIESVLNPTKHEYFYFVADVCGDGKVYYAKTFAEHEKNVYEYLTKKGCIH